MSKQAKNEQIFNSLDSLKKSKILLHGLYQGADLLRDITQTNFIGTGIRANLKQREQGISMSVNKAGTLVKVYLIPKLFMHWFEKGTKDRQTLSGKSTGRIEGKHYFRDARANEEQIYNEIIHTIDNSIDKII